MVGVEVMEIRSERGKVVKGVKRGKTNVEVMMVLEFRGDVGGKKCDVVSKEEMC